MKRHRLERQDGFAGFVHRFNLLFKPARGADRPELPGGVDHHIDSVVLDRRGAANVADKAGVAHVRTNGADNPARYGFQTGLRENGQNIANQEIRPKVQLFAQCAEGS